MPSPDYQWEIEPFFAQFPPAMTSLTSVPQMSSIDKLLPNVIPQHHLLYIPSQIPTSEHNEWDLALQQLVAGVLRERGQDLSDSSATHQGETEQNQKYISDSTPSSEEYLIEQKNPFNEGLDDGR